MKLSSKPIPSLTALLKGNFFSGLLIVVPLGVIAWILAAVLRAIWSLHAVLPTALQPDSLFADPLIADIFRFGITLGVVLLLALGVSLLGWLSKLYLGRKILNILGYVIQRIPVIRSVYSSLDQLMRAFAVGGQGQFSRVVYVEYPRKGMWTLAFVTGQAKAKALSGKHLNLFVPTTPNPTSGFYLIVPEEEVREADLSVEEAFKVLLSLGIVGK